MGTTLTGTTPQDTYDSLIKVTDNGPISGTAKYLSDGLGNDSALAMSTTQVGIGTASPAQNLHISSSQTTAYAASSASLIQPDGGSNLLIQNTGAAGFTSLRFAALNTSNAVGYLGFTNNTANVGGSFIFGQRTGASSYAEQMRITDTGNVGIGTSSPARLLHSSASYAAPTGGIDANVQILASNTSGASGINMLASNASVSFLHFGDNDAANVGQIAYTHANDNMLFVVGGAERFRMTPSGLTFNGDTAAANALDDYEEGTFTPTVAGSTTAGTATYTTQLARYTKIGRQVSCQIDLGYNSGTGTGNLTIAGLPFTDAGLNNPAVTIGYLDGITLTANNYALAYLASGTTRIDFVQIPTGGGSLTSVSYDSEGRIILNVTYTA
jgi:hypothetical protein